MRRCIEYPPRSRWHAGAPSTSRDSPTEYTMGPLKRRDFLQTGAMALGGAFLTSRLAFARTGSSKSRFVFIIMRGALDGLAAVPPYGDSDYASLRRELAL